MPPSIGQSASQRYVAFLRAINVGTRRVSMETLRQAFEGPGVMDVETFLASGNVVFRTGRADGRSLERVIERRLSANLGFPVDVFVRSASELGAAAGATPFDTAAVEASAAYNVGFLRAPLTVVEQRALGGLATDIDRLAAIGREVYWLCAVRQSDSTFSNAVMEKALGLRATFRSMSTLLKMAARWNATGARGQIRTKSSNPTTSSIRSSSSPTSGNVSGITSSGEMR